MNLRAKQRWPTAIANEVSNFYPGIKSGVSPIERFSQVDVKPRVITDSYQLSTEITEGPGGLAVRSVDQLPGGMRLSS
jgi:hypothetical protein